MSKLLPASSQQQSKQLKIKERKPFVRTRQTGRTCALVWLAKLWPKLQVVTECQQQQQQQR